MKTGPEQEKKRAALRSEKPGMLRRKEVHSLEDIPEFNTSEDEVKFWHSHRLSKDILDQIREPTEEEKY